MIAYLLRDLHSASFLEDFEFVYFADFEVLGSAQGSLGVHEEGVWDDLGVVLEGREAQGIAPGRSLDRSRVP